MDEGEETKKIIFHPTCTYIDIGVWRIDVVIIGDEGDNLNGSRQGNEKYIFHLVDTRINVGFCKIDVAHRGEVGAIFNGTMRKHKGDYFHLLLVMEQHKTLNMISL